MGKPTDRSKRLFGRLDSFDAVFPTLDGVAVEFIESEFGIEKRSGVWHVNREGGLMACGNPRCQRGGYEFDREVHQMVKEHATDREIEISCRGDEGTPQGRRIGRHRLFSVTAKIGVKYKT
jgi:hypothetical protein